MMKIQHQIIPFDMSQKHKFYLFVGISISLFLTSACKPLLFNEQPERLTYFTITSHQAIGQTFVARFNGLSTIQVYLNPDMSNCKQSNLILRLTPSPFSSRIIDESIIPVSKIKQTGFYNFYFHPVRNSKGHSYFAQLSLTDDCSIDLATSQYQSYIDGTLYFNEQPVDAQLSFSLGYNLKWLIFSLFFEVLKWLGIFGIVFFLFSIPGYTLLTIFPLFVKTYHWTINLAASFSIGLVIYPIIVLWLHPFQLPLWVIGITPSLLSLIYLIWKKTFDLRDIKIVYPSLESVLFLVIIALVFISRVWVIRNLSAPMWGDSVQHTAMTQLILDNNGLFKSWLPYAPYQSLTVQYNFSLLSAIFASVINITASNATLWMGQIINFIAILALYPISIKISQGNRISGCITMIIAGLVSPMPAYYVNWGRYPQLTGQAILPIVLYLLLETLDKNPLNLEVNLLTMVNSLPWQNKIGLSIRKIISESILPALLIAGMALSYYRMPYFLAVFIPCWILILILKKEYKSLYQYYLPVLFTSFLLSILFIYPWLNNLQGSNLATSLENSISKSSSLSLLLENYRPWLDYNNYLPHLTIWLFGIAFIIALWNKYQSPLIIILWSIFLFLLPSMGILHIPGIGFINTFSILIAFYIPISIILGWLSCWLVEHLPRSWKNYILLGLILFVPVLAYHGRSIANQRLYALVTKPDLNAFTWIIQKIPTDSRFLVEGFRIYNGKSIVGSDAGWWLPIFTKRQNTMPPQYALLTEKPFTPTQNQELIEIVATLEQFSLNSIEGFTTLCKNQITHIYIGQRRGNIGAGVQILYLPEELFSSPWYRQIYHQDGVYIYRLKLSLCP